MFERVRSMEALLMQVAAPLLLLENSTLSFFFLFRVIWLAHLAEAVVLRPHRVVQPCDSILQFLQRGGEGDELWGRVGNGAEAQRQIRRRVHALTGLDFNPNEISYTLFLGEIQSIL